MMVECQTEIYSRMATTQQELSFLSCYVIEWAT